MPLELSKHREQSHGRAKDFREQKRKSKVLGRECLEKRERKKIVLGKIYEAIQLHRVKDCITGRNSQMEKSIKIFLLLYIVCILFYIIMRLNYLIKYANVQ